MDWNWFFSSVAQSVAALVGVLGAFLVAKLLADQSAFESDQTRARQLIRTSERLADAAGRRYFRWYCERELDSALRRLAGELKDAEELLDAYKYYETCGIPRFIPRTFAVQKIEEVVETAQKRRKYPASQSLFSDFPILTDPALIASGRQELAAEGEAIEHLALDVKDNISALREHHERISSQPQQSRILPVLIVALLLLFWGGVLLPLMVLPVPTSTSAAVLPAGVVVLKWAVLALAGIVFTGLLLTLRGIGKRMRHSPQDLEMLESWVDPGRYSEYFSVCIENGFEL